MKALNIAASAALLFSSQLFAVPVNINQADAETLASALHGVGRNKAMAIVEYREQHGPFAEPADIVKVQGIGQGTFEKNRMDILVE